jgi:hypothetical protein
MREVNPFKHHRLISGLSLVAQNGSLTTGKVDALMGFCSGLLMKARTSLQQT